MSAAASVGHDAVGRELFVVDIPMRIRFRGITRRQALLVRGDAGWGEFSPFLDYDGPELVPWLRACWEASDEGFPTALRHEVEVNVTVPVIPPDAAHRLVAGSGCRTAKVKVADPRETLRDDVARVEAVRDALGPHGRLRVDANGAWTIEQAVVALRELGRFNLEYAEQPCASVEDLAALRRRLHTERIAVAIAADESIRRSGDPERVAALRAADVAVLKVQPLGGVRACLDLSERLALPVAVSSALETSVGLAAGAALAAALPGGTPACGLNTRALLEGDVTVKSLAADGGTIGVRRVDADPELLERWAASPDVAQWWIERYRATAQLAGVAA